MQARKLPWAGKKPQVQRPPPVVEVRSHFSVASPFPEEIAAASGKAVGKHGVVNTVEDTYQFVRNPASYSQSRSR